MVIQAKAAIGMALKVEPAKLDLGTLSADQQSEHHLEVTNRGPKPIRLLYAMSDLPGLVALVPREAVEPGQTVQVPVRIDGTRMEPGRHRTFLKINTSEARQRVLSVLVEMEVSR